jgi:anti-anti-sigma factor
MPPVLALPVEVTADALPAIGAEADRLLGADGARLVVDLWEVRFLGSGGLGELVKLGMRLRERGGGLVLARPRPPVRKLVALVGLDEVLPLCETLEEAWARLGAPAE